VEVRADLVRADLIHAELIHRNHAAAV